ncbi:unnamed protein product [Fusarium equiseti]|uniref:Chitin-binding type-1 domain-containing protein n=1 Tax=Fusarium equiseti TaxID=61235 RepID=A0A8J2NHV5_FUSEQ|nr:unnamed protein product [Fusarium equiseti]
MRKLLTALVTIIALFCQLSLQAEAQCSKTKLCEDGYCSSAGYCGYGPDFCGKHGFCGFTEEFCVPEFPGFKEKKEKPKKQESHLPGICHWTSCFEECPSGYKSVQRDGHKEIMLDDTHCEDNLEGKGFSRLCCPSDQELPVCRWRGHHDRKCTPGCNKGEVEVGTTKAGCRKNHQSACCDLTDATAAYDKCYWSGCVEEGSNPCGGNFASHVASSKIGSGGIRRCSNTQTRAFCCSNPAPFPFNNRCEWVRKAGFLEADSLWNFCEGACHKGQVRVALESGLDYGNANNGKGGCDGEVAYCCDFESKLDKREEDEDEDEDGVEGASEFSMLLDKYLENPTCPATTLHPNLHDDSKYRDSFHKRDLIAESVCFEVLAGRATDCYEDNWHRLLGYAVLIFKAEESGIKPMWKIWDAKFARRFGQAVTAYSIVQFLKDLPKYDPYGVIERILYFPNDAASGLDGARSAATDLCRVPPTPGNRPSRRSEIGKRVVNLWAARNANADIPPLINILEGILNRQLTLHYARWQYMSGASSEANAGPFLELAYWIGQDPGNAAEVFDRSEFEDGTYRTEDRWVVFHFHIGHPVPAQHDPDFDQPPMDWIAEDGGHSYMGVEAVSVYHGQRVWGAGSGMYAWRVDGRDTAFNARSTYVCGEDGLWYVGTEARAGTWDMRPRGRAMRALERFGMMLWEQGYVRGPGLRLILEGGDLHYQGGREINPLDPGRVLGEEEPNRLLGGNPTNPPPGEMEDWDRVDQINGYTVNWLLDGEDYNFAPPSPPDL